MGNKLYVGNLAFSATETDIQRWFAAHGTVVSAKIITDRTTGRSKGFAFVEMSNDSEAKAAVAALNGADQDGRKLTVNEARPKEDRGGSRGSQVYGSSHRF